MHFTQPLKDFHDFLSDLPLAGKFTHIFYVLGPLFLLIERSPADAWLSVCGVVFLFHCGFNNDWGWLKVLWVRLAFLFWFIGIFSALFSVLPFYALGEILVWFRFPLFAFASCFYFCKDKRVFYAMAISIFLGMILMTGILIAEISIVGVRDGRLSWPYGDLVPGNYLAKACLPIFCLLVAVAVANRGRISLFSAVISIVTIVVSLFAGERINFLIRACGGLLAGLSWKPKLLSYLLLVLFEIIALSAVFLSDRVLSHRYVDSFVEQLPVHDESPYLRVWKGGFVAFESSPIIGIGPDVYRKLCPALTVGRSGIDCHTHPHNFYIQLAGETGVIGLAAGILMISAIIWTCFSYRRVNKDNPFTAVAFVVPLAVFFPIQSTGDFFGQWNNLFMWSAVAFALSSRTLLDDKK
jgi:O-antigen ligase